MGRKAKPLYDHWTVDPITECWIWNLSYDGKGYGQKRIGSIKDGSRRVVRAHRWVYQQLIGDIPDDLELDHLCRNRFCVNPDHLDPVSHNINVMRANRRQSCKRGHILVGDNIKWRSDGTRECRVCVNNLWNERYSRINGPGC